MRVRTRSSGHGYAFSQVSQRFEALTSAFRNTPCALTRRRSQVRGLQRPLGLAGDGAAGPSQIRVRSRRHRRGTTTNERRLCVGGSRARAHPFRDESTGRRAPLLGDHGNVVLKSEPPRHSWRLQPLRDGAMSRRGRYRGRFVTARCGWCWSMRTIMSRSGRRSCRSRCSPGTLSGRPETPHRVIEASPWRCDHRVPWRSVFRAILTKGYLRPNRRS
jgi:hypothetical protein